MAHDTEYAKLIALSREMHRQNEEVRYKLINPPPESALEKSLAGMTIRHTYTHGSKLDELNTVKPVYSDRPRETQKVVFVDRFL